MGKTPSSSKTHSRRYPARALRRRRWAYRFDSPDDFRQPSQGHPSAQTSGGRTGRHPKIRSATASVSATNLLASAAYGSLGLQFNKPGTRTRKSGNCGHPLDWHAAGKRENRRLRRDYTMTQNDIEAVRHLRGHGRFGGFGRWTDHHPAGLLLPRCADGSFHPATVALRHPFPLPLFRATIRPNLASSPVATSR